MNREDIVLAALASSNGALYSPVQIQKLMFLIDKNFGNALDGPHFNFQPYNYGPFDKAVYETLENLAKHELVEIVNVRSWKEYTLTAKGKEKGEILLGTLPQNIRNYIAEVSDFVRKLSFTQLVSAIYKAYPEMRQNSVFQG